MNEQVTLPVLDGRAWVGRGSRFGTAFLVELFESRQFPGYYHRAVWCVGASFLDESLRPLKADVLQEHLDVVALSHGLRASDLEWREAAIEDLILLGDRARKGD